MIDGLYDDNGLQHSVVESYDQNNRKSTIFCCFGHCSHDLIKSTKFCKDTNKFLLLLVLQIFLDQINKNSINFINYNFFIHKHTNSIMIWWLKDVVCKGKFLNSNLNANTCWCDSQHCYYATLTNADMAINVVWPNANVVINVVDVAVDCDVILKKN